MNALPRTVLWLVWLTVLVFGSGLDAYGQSGPCESWSKELVDEEFANPYLRARHAEAAATLLKEDPFSEPALALLVRAGRDDEAVTLAERIGHARPDVLASAFVELQQLTSSYAPWDPRHEAVTARLTTLREQVRRAPTSSAAEPLPANKAASSEPAASSESERTLLDARQQVARTHETLSHRGKWSVHDAATATAPGQRLLRGLAERDRGPCGRQALALLARSEFEAGQLREAAGDFNLLAERYQDSDLAWAAGMRVAQLTQSLGDPAAAAEQFARLSVSHAGKPTIQALASFYEARAYEAGERWGDALRAYRTAFSAWPANDPDWIGLDWKVLNFTDPFVRSLWPRGISRRNVAQRIKVLTQVEAVPSSGDIERATWLLDHRRPSEASELLLRPTETLQGTMPPPLVRSLLHRATVDRAVAAISRRGRLPRQSVLALKQLCDEPFDAWVGVGCAVHASVLAVEGQDAAAEAELRQTFRRWVEAQNGAMKPPIPENEIARDAMTIRDLLLTPASAPFILTPSALRITTGQGAESFDIEATTPHGHSNVILLAAVEARTLWDAVERLSACDDGRRSRRLDRSWRTAVGFASDYCALGNPRYTAPTVDSIHFMNLEGTRAHAVVGDSGGGHVAVIEKVDGEWRVTGTAGSWAN